MEVSTIIRVSARAGSTLIAAANVKPSISAFGHPGVDDPTSLQKVRKIDKKLHGRTTIANSDPLRLEIQALTHLRSRHRRGIHTFILPRRKRGNRSILDY